MELTAGEAWSRILESVRPKLPEHSFQTWLAPTRGVALTQDLLEVAAPSEFAAEWIEDKYGELLSTGAQALFGEGFRLAFTAGPVDGSEDRDFPSVGQAELTELGSARQPAARPKSPDEASCTVGILNPRYTLEHFVVARNNELAAAAARAVADAPGRAYNPLFIHGGVGLGKTHLMQAIGHAVLTREPARRIAYVSCEHFMNELIAAIQERRTKEFHARYRRMDVLLVDDIHFLAGREATQEEFFHTFNALHDAQRQIVLTSDRSPSEIPNLQHRLTTRFEWGLVTDIQPPEFETRMAILRLKAEREQLALDDDVLALIASRCSSSVRALEGAIIKLLAFGSLTSREVTPAFAEEVLGASFSFDAAEPGVESIVSAVAAEFGLSVDRVASRSRQREVALARQVAMYVLRDLADLPYAEIGRILGGRDHSTVMHGIRKIEGLLEDDAEFQQRFRSLRDGLAARRAVR